MNSVIFCVIMSTIGIVLVPIILLGAVIYGDYKAAKEMKKFKEVVNQCTAVYGWDFTSKVLTKCSNNNLLISSRIEVLEYFIKCSNKTQQERN